MTIDNPDGWLRPSLLAPKLDVPRPHPHFVSRERLLRRLEVEISRGLVLVCAPAGYGKTALLADLTRRTRRCAAWLSLDPGDNEPSRFWHHAVAAIGRARPGFGERVAELVEQREPALCGLVTAVINELAAQDDEMLLVLDDYHLIDSRQVDASLMFLFEHLPANLAVALTSRSEPALPLARLRALGQLADVAAADLRFTADEAAVLMREALAPDLTEAAIETLVARTEGWTAGLHLAAVSLRGNADIAGGIASFGGGHRHVLDYLTQEVLDRQSEELRTWLLETSVLDGLCGSLCDAVTGRTDGEVMLEAVERANLFLLPLDGRHGWWRYHRMFAETLRTRLDREGPARVQQLHRRAAAWYQARGMAGDALRHALEAGGGEAGAERLAEIERSGPAGVAVGAGAGGVVLDPLTARELEVLRLVAVGRSNLRIAHEFVLSLDTVKKHVSNILDKLGAANRTEAVALARSLGLIG